MSTRNDIDPALNKSLEVIRQMMREHTQAADALQAAAISGPRITVSIHGINRTRRDTLMRAARYREWADQCDRIINAIVANQRKRNA